MDEFHGCSQTAIPNQYASFEVYVDSRIAEDGGVNTRPSSRVTERESSACETVWKLSRGGVYGNVVSCLDWKSSKERVFLVFAILRGFAPRVLN